MSGHATINRFYRLVWSEAQGAWVAVAENVRGRGKSSGRGAFMAALFASLGLVPLAHAGPPTPNQLPTGGVVVGGQVVIGQSGATMTIDQATQRGAVDWQTFNVGSQAQVNFRQPSAASVTLNRVLDTQASQIFGRISANGQVFLSNPNGVYFSPTASVDVGGLVATTHTISTADFMAGKNTFNRSGATGSVINDGTLQASLNGYIALLAPEVRNHGIVLAQAGTVALAAGDAIELQFENNRSLAGVLVTPSAIAALVENGSAVHAPGGLIIMSAQAANQLQGGVVRNSGALEATGLSQRGGKIVLDSSGLVDNSGSVDVSGSGGGRIAVSADRMLNTGSLRADGTSGDGGSIGSTLANGLVETTGATVSAQGGNGSIAIDGGAGSIYTSGTYLADGPVGGKVVLTANTVALMGAKVSATGQSHGGTILVGGDYQGKNAAINNAINTTVGNGVTLNADATANGDGGKVVVWSEQKTVFAGDASARGGAAGGNGGVLEVSGKETLHFGGTASAYAANGKSGSLLLDPKDIFIDNDLSGQLELLDPHPTVGGTFGKTTTALTSTSGATVTRTGYIVVTNPDDNLGATGSGAAYLFRQSDQALISTLYGTHAGDKVGSNGVTSLTNGNYVVSSPLWNNAMGAVSWGSGTTGWGNGSVALSSSNSLVGSSGIHQSTMNQATSDNIGGYAITVLPNGNYLVGTPSWSDNRGALTFGNGATGVSGVVSASNSLVGSTAMTIVPADGYKQYKYGDQVGGSVTVLANGNYAFANANWNKGVGAVTFASGTTGISGVVSATNSLVGDSSRSDATGNGSGTDKIGKYLTVLTGSQFVVFSSDWKNFSGALTSFDGNTAVTGLVAAGNSLVGNANDGLSSSGLTVLPSNNAFVISSPSWNGGRGAATWVPFGTDVKTIAVASNGVVGVNTGDSIGSKGVTVLTNGDYVLSSPNFNGARGASTLVEGSTGRAKKDAGGTVTATNSLVGSQANDQVASSGIVELTGNGNYVVLSPYWANIGNTKAGAVTWSSGTTPTVGALTSSNSLVGSNSNDRIGTYQYNYYQYNNPTPILNEANSVLALSNGNYVVSSPMWNSTRGAVTWSSGTSGATINSGHTITAANSLIGANTADFIGAFVVPNDVITNTINNTSTHYDALSNGVTALSNGNYVTISDYWRNGAALRAGAITWSDGATAPTVGAVTASNSLVGTVLDDMVGLGKDNGYGIKRLESGYDSVGNATYSGNYVVTSNKWNNASIVDAGAVTWGSGTAALTGTISNANSVLGLKTNDVQGWGVVPLPVNGNYLIQNQAWDNGAAAGAGALTWIDGASGRLSDYAAQGNHNVVSSVNSLVGSHAGDNVGGTVDYLFNYDTVNSRQRFTGNYVAITYNWTNDTKENAGAVTWGDGTSGVSGVISRGNSQVGEKASDYLGSYYVALSNGNYLLANPTLDVNGVVNAGAVSWVDGSTGRLNDYAAQGNQNIMSSANALVGSHVNDYIGTSLAPAYYYALNPADYGNTGYFIISPDWNCGAGAVNYITDASVPLSGVVGSGNAAIGNPNGRFWGGLTYNPYLSLAANGAGIVTFSGDNGHVVLVTPTMPAASAMWLPGATAFGDSQAATQAMTPDYIAGVLKTGTSVTLQANNDIFVKSGIDATGGTAGGSLTMQAGRSITVLGDIITGNRDLNLTANDSLANGVKNAYRDAGIATLSMGKNAQGVAAKIDAGSGDVSLLIAAGTDKTNHMGGSISVNSITARTIKLVNQGDGAGTIADLPNLAANCCGFDLGYRAIGADITLNAGAVLTANGTGTAVTLAAKGKFNNNSGTAGAGIVMTDPAARWLVYASAPGTSTYAGLDSQNTAIWNTTYTGAPLAQGGNRYVFAYQPTITVGTQDVSKTYGEDLTTGTTLVDRVVSLSGAQAAVAGAYLGDTVATALSGTISATSAGAAANAGVAGGPYAISVNLAGATGNNGYAVALGSNTPRTITIGKKTLTAALTGVSKAYDASNAAMLAAGNYVLSGLVGAESFNVTKASGLYNATDITASSASATLVAGDFSAGSGTLASNYTLPVSASGAASITPKALTATLSGVGKTYDGSNTAVLSGGNYVLGGFAGGQSASVNHAAGLYNSADVVGATSVSATLAAPDFTAAGGTSLANYILPTTASGAASIAPKALTAALGGTIAKIYDGATSATLTGANYTLSGFIGAQSASVTKTSGVYNSVNVAGATGVTASLAAGDFVAGSGTLLSNYSLPVAASGAASIGAKALSASLTGSLGRDYNATTAATLSGANYSLGGLVGSESFAVTKTTGVYDSVNAGARTLAVTLAGGDFTAGSGTLLGNYILPTSASGAAVIAPKAITLTAPSVSKVYDGTLAYTTTAGDLTGLSGGLLGKDSITGATFSYTDKNAGSGSKAVSFGSVAISDGNGGANYAVTLAGNSTGTITPRTLNVNATGINRVYDTTTNATVTLGDDRIAGDIVNLSNTSASFADKNAGNGKTVSVAGIAKAGTDAGNYTLASTAASTSANITPATLQVVGITGGSRSYDTSLNATLSGKATVTALGADVVAVLGSGAGQFADKNAGTGKSIAVSGYTTSDTNYILLQPTGVTGTITPAVLQLGGLTSSVAKTYDGTTTAKLSGSPVVTGLGGEVVSVVGSGTGQFGDKNAGTGKAITVNGYTASDSNYTIGQQPGLTGSITPAQLTIASVSGTSRTYDGTTAAQAGNYSLNGLIGSDTVGVTKTSGTYDSANAGTRTLSVSLAGGDFMAGSGTLLGNYLLPTSATGSGLITPKAITLTAPSISKVYDGTLAYTTTSGDLSGLNSALVGKDSITGATFSYTDKNAGSGSKAVAFGSVAISDGNNGGNYSVTLAGNSSSTITPRVLNVGASGVDRVYDTTTNASVTLSDDRIAGDTVNLSNASATFADKNAGNGKTVSVSGIAKAGTDAGNYTLAGTTTTTSANITPATLQVVGITGGSRSYDTSLTATLSGKATVTALGADVVAVLGSGSGQFADKNAGSGKPISVSGYSSSDTNYILLQPTGVTGTITPAVLQLGGLTSSVAKTYDGTTAAQLAGTPLVTGLGGEVVSVVGSGTGQFGDKNAGTGKAITVNGYTASDSNYTIGQQPGLTGNINPAQLTVASVTGTSRTYDGTTAAQTGGYNLNGLIGADTVGVTKTSGSYDSANAGVRTLSVSLAGGDFTAGSGTLLGNYLLPTSASGSGLITPKSITLTVPSVSKVYDGTLAYTTTSGDLSGLSGGLLGKDSITGATFSYADKNAGSGSKAVSFGSVAISDGNNGGNYSVTLAGNSSSTITPRILNVGASGVDRVYDTTTNASVTLSDDRIAGDTVNLSNASATFADKNAGNGKTVSVSGIANAGTDAGNYTLAGTTTTTSANITPATLQVVGITGGSRSYDTSLTATLSGKATVTALGADVVTVLGSGSGQFADKNAGSGKPISVSGYSSSDTNYILLQPTGVTGTITPAVLQLGGLTSSVAKTYDGTTTANLSGSPVVTGLGGEVVSVVGSGTGQFGDKNAGTGKAITVAGYTASDSNYTIGQQPGLTGSTTPAQLTIASVSGTSRTYDGTTAAQAGNYSVNGLIGADTVGVTKTSGTYDSANAGTRTLSVSLAGGDFTAGSGTLLGNYLLPTSASGSGLITPKSITLTAPSISKVYDGTLAYTTTSGDLSGLNSALVGKDSITGATFSYADKNAGSGSKAVSFGSVAISDGNNGGNYSVTLAGNSSSTITPRVLNVGATGIDRVYDTTTNATVTLSDDRIAGDTVNLSNASATFADKNADNGKTVSVSGIAKAGTDAGNYTLAGTTTTTSANITPATLQVVGITGGSRSYDTSLTATLSGKATVTALGADVVTVLGSGSGQFADKNAGSGKPISVSGYSSSDTNYILLQPSGVTGTITPAVLQLGGLTSSGAKTYDGTTTANLSGSPVVTGLGGEVVSVVGSGTGQFGDKNAGTGKAITVAGYTASDSNYTIGQQPGLTGNINPAQLTVASVTGTSRTYDGTTAAQTGGYNLNGLIGADTVGVTKTSGSYDSANAGVRTLSVSLAGGDFTAGSGTLLGNYLLPTSATGSGLITPKAITLTAPSVSKVYDGTLAYTTTTGDLSGLNSALVGKDSITGATFSYADKNAAAGSKAVAFGGVTISDGNNGGNYSVTLAGNSSSTITPRILNVGASGVDRVYDTTTNASVTLSDDRIAGDFLNLSNSSASFADKNAGNGKVITVAGIGSSGIDAGNYVLASNSATASANITPATLQVGGVTAVSRAYDRSLNVVLGGAPGVTALGSDIVTVLGSGSGTYADKNAGSGKAITVSGYTSSDSNYVLLQPTGLTGTITPAVLQLGGLTSGITKTYDGTTTAQLSGTPLVTGFGGEVVSVVGNGTGQFGDKNAGIGKAITVYGYTASDSNYAIGQQPGLTGDIGRAVLGVGSVTGVTRQYDGSTLAQVGGYSLSGLVGGDAISVTKANGVYDSDNAGLRSLSVSLASGDFAAASGTLLGNYLLPASASGSGLITPKMITLVAPSLGKVYDGTLSYSATSGNLSSLSAALVDGDSVSGASFSYADKNAGSGNKAVSFGAVTINDGNNGGNYSVTLAGNTSSTITPRLLNVSARATDRSYDTGTAAAVTLADDRIAGDTLNLSSGAASFADKNAGSGKIVTVSGITAAGADAGNYALASATATARANITPATLQVNGITAGNRSYDTSLNAVLTGKASVTALGSDVVSVLGSGAGSYADKNAGVGKAITVSGYTSSDSNYVLLQPSGLSGTITPAVLQVSGLTLAAAKTYDGTRSASLSGTALVTGLGGEVVSAGGNGSGQFADKNVGQGKAITLSGYTSSDSNYSIGQQPGLVGSIVPASVTVGGVRANDKAYDGTTVASLGGVAQVNVFGTDSVSVAGAPSASFADAAAGSAKPVTVSGYALAGADAGNYRLSQPSGLSADIVDAAVIVPPPVVVVPPPLPAAPTPAELAGAGLTMPPLQTGAASNAAGLSTAPATLATTTTTTTTAAQSTTAPLAATTVTNAATVAITVSLVRETTLRQNGVVAVSVPKEISNAGKGYSFPLPAQVVEAAAVNRVDIIATTATGEALPSWISFNADSKTFVVSGTAPQGALPLQVQLLIGSQKATMMISEGQ